MRFEEIVGAVPACEVLTEVGCDHAKLTALALSRGLCRSAVVSDISPACLEKAKLTLRGYPNVTYLVGDGVVAKNADCVLICGMGGHTVRDILLRYDGAATLVLSPQSHAELVRQTLVDKAYAIDVDRCFADSGKYYDLIRAKKGKMLLTDMQLAYGAYYKTKNGALAARLRRVLTNLNGNIEANAGRIAEIEEVLAWQQ